jgi:glycerol-3-phosphate dehydrogenase (NAD(P)+)
MANRESVAVIGSGSMGSTLAHATFVAGHPTTIWCADPARAEALDGRFQRGRAGNAADRVRVSTVMADTVRDAALIVVAVPSAEYRGAARALASLDIAGKVLLSSTKGFEPETRMLLSKVLEREIGAAAVGVIAGANITPEIVAGQLSALVVASESPEVGALAKACLESEQLRVWLCEDRNSVELVAALKNVVAIGVGIATGLELGFNARAIVFASGLKEIVTLGAALGADPAAFLGVAGVGDLFLTASSPDSLNRRLGVALGRGKRLADVVGELPEVPEGIGSVRACLDLARKHALDLPIAATVAAILEGALAPISLEAACRRSALV